MSNNKDFKIKNGIKPTVYQETLGTVVSVTEGYTLSSASYDSVSFSVSGQDTSPKEVFFKSDGNKMYVLGGAGGDVNEYNLSTAWDIATASYSQNFTVSGQESSPEGVFFKPDGTKMYITGGSGDDINEYNLSTAWDVTTASYNQNFSVSDGDPKQVFFKPDGNKMFIVGAGSGVGTVYEYALSTSWDISTASYTQSFSVSTQDTSPESFFFAPDGNKMFVMGAANDIVYQYSLSTAWDLSTASYTQGFGVSTQEDGPKGVFFKSDGTKMYVIGSSTDRVYQYSTTLATAQLDLSTGSVFDYTPTSNAQVKLTNPAASGTASGATLLLGSEDSTGVGSTFSTTLYTGNDSAQTITNNLDFSTDGGMLWIKSRTDASDHVIYDTVRGPTKTLYSNLSNVEGTQTTNLAFNTDGVSFNNTFGNMNGNGTNYVSWAFKKKTKFFDIVTYTGTGSAMTINHNLGQVPGMIMVKARSVQYNWAVWHREFTGTTDYIKLSSANAKTDSAGVFGDGSQYLTPTSTQFFVGGNNQVSGQVGGTYVAYIFAHDTDASSLIKCGSYTGTGSANNAVTLGWEPQWLMVKSATRAGQNWEMFDNQRGFLSGSNTAELFPNASTAERSAFNVMNATSTGFSTGTSVMDETNETGQTYIYMAIRNSSVPTITYDPNLQWSGGTAPTLPATGETDVITFNTTDGGTTYKSALAIDGAK